MKKTLVLSLFISLLTTILATQFSCAVLQKSEFERNRRLWRESGVKNYRMTVDLQKTGHATPNGKFIITVRDGIAKSKQYADNLKPVPETVRFGSYVTLDEMFNYIEQAEKDTGDWHRKEIQYDAKLGYPKKVDMDKARSLDDEIYFYVLQFEILE